MIIKVVKCTGPLYWYKDDIGKIFKVSDLISAGGLYKLDSSHGKYFEIGDCIIVDEHRDNILNELGI